MICTRHVFRATFEPVLKLFIGKEPGLVSTNIYKFCQVVIKFVLIMLLITNVTEFRQKEFPF